MKSETGSSGRSLAGLSRASHVYGLTLSTGGRDAAIRGMTLAEVAVERGLDPIEAAIEIIGTGAPESARST